MLTKIEEKLSAIKAINEQKDNIDKMIEKMDAAVEQIHYITLMDGTVIYPGGQVEADIWHILRTDFESKREQLIKQAQELMK